ncbi:hypothetical protein LCGC14_1793000 [marine sediment metagenome]|uniref:Transglycosylase SLT domain-containing protein n=1 Tax=marine sediment metagenome TaxID=412755 RepID=A0A0F9J6R6_9ZZZZ
MKILLILFLLCGVVEGAEIVDIDIIIQIESSGNEFAHNEQSDAKGLMQITPVCLAEFKQFHKGKFVARTEDWGDWKYSAKWNAYEIRDEWDLFIPQVNVMIGYWYINNRIPQMLKAYKIYPSIKDLDLYIIACYNWGIGRVVKWHRAGAEYKKLPQETRRYYERYVQIKSNKLEKR